jgi:hypothetical protein
VPERKPNEALMRVIFALLITLVIASANAGGLNGRGAAVWTPPPGNPVRGAVLDALRAELRRFHHMDLLFVVDVLRVQNGWAWVETRPQSRDGANHYEPVSALLRERDGSWSIIDIPCTDEGEPECVAEPELFSRLRARFPSLPHDLLSDRPAR